MSELILKPRTHYDNYHEVCKSFCSGNGSVIQPYRCPCGTWYFNDDTNNYELEDNI